MGGLSRAFKKESEQSKERMTEGSKQFIYTATGDIKSPSGRKKTVHFQAMVYFTEEVDRLIKLSDYNDAFHNKHPWEVWKQDFKSRTL